MRRAKYIGQIEALAGEPALVQEKPGAATVRAQFDRIGLYIDRSELQLPAPIYGHLALGWREFPTTDFEISSSLETDR